MLLCSFFDSKMTIYISNFDVKFLRCCFDDLLWRDNSPIDKICSITDGQMDSK